MYKFNIILFIHFNQNTKKKKKNYKRLLRIMTKSSVFTSIFKFKCFSKTINPSSY